MANIDIQISQLPSLANLTPTDLFHVKRGSIDYKVSFSELFKLHANNHSNPHQVTKVQVGLGQVLDTKQLAVSNNLADLDDASIARGNLVVYSKQEVDNNLLAHTSRRDNPHQVTKQQVGLGSLENAEQLQLSKNLSDVPNKQLARDNLNVYSKDDIPQVIDLQHSGRKDNPHNVTKLQVGLGNLENWTYSTNYLEDSNTKYATIGAVYKAFQDATGDGQTNLAAHLAATNPHRITSAMIGLGSVNNAAWTDSISDIDTSQRKYATNISVSSAVSSANSYSDSSINTHLAATNPHNITKAMVGLGSLQNATWTDNIADTTGNQKYATNIAVGKAREDVRTFSQNLIDTHLAATNPHNITATMLGLGNVDNFVSSSSWNNNSASTYATTRAVYDAYNQIKLVELDKYVLSDGDDITGNLNLVSGGEIQIDAKTVLQGSSTLTEIGNDTITTTRVEANTNIILNKNTTVNGVISATGDVVGFATSDMRLKKDLKPFENPLEELCKLDVGTYLKLQPDGEYVEEAGIMAQQIQKILPTIVKDRGDGYLAIKTGGYSVEAYLIAAIQELNKKLENLK